MLTKFGGIMSKFTTPLIGEWNDEMTKFTLRESFVYYVGSLNSNDKIEIPVGYVTDFASVPEKLHWLLHPVGPYGKAAVLHDYLYDKGLRTKKVADLIFLEAMGVLKVPKYIRYTMYYAVKYFGKGNYDKNV